MQSQFVTDALDTSTLLKTLIAFKDGDFSARLPVDQTGVAGKIADTLNEIFKLNERMAGEFARISSAVGKEGKINQRAGRGSASGRWAECLESANGLIGELVQPSTAVTRGIGSVAQGDLAERRAVYRDRDRLKGHELTNLA